MRKYLKIQSEKKKLYQIEVYHLLKFPEDLHYLKPFYNFIRIACGVHISFLTANVTLEATRSCSTIVSLAAK